MMVYCRYIRKRVHRMLLMMFLSVSVFIFFLTLSVQFKFVKHDYHAEHALKYALEVLPVNIYTVFPLLLVLGLWILFYRLHSKGELMQMYASGVTPNRIVSWLRFPLALWIGGLILLGDCAGPLLEKHAKKRRMQAMMDYQVVENDRLLWLKDATGFIEATRTDRYDELSSLRRYVFVDHRLVSIESIPLAVFKNQKWHMSQGEKTILYPSVKLEQTLPQIWNTRLTPELLGLSNSGPGQKPLYQLIPVLGSSSLGLFTKKDLGIFWARFFMPVKVGLLSLWLCYVASGVCLWRLAQSQVYYSLLGCILFGCAGIFLRQYSLWMFPDAPYIGDILACWILLYYIYRGKSASMINLFSQ